MLTLVLMKIAADLALYYTYAGFFAALFGASSQGMLLALVIQAAAFTLAYALRWLGPWRYIPLVLLALGWFVPGTGLANFIVIAPPAFYEIYLVRHNIYKPDWSQQKQIFSVFWKAFLAFSFFCALIGETERVRSAVLPFGVLTLMCSVLLMRSLRHEPQVYCQVKYQAVNLLLLCAVGAGALVLSSELFLDACLGILQLLGKWVVSPILLSFAYIIMAIIKGIAWLCSLFNFHIAVPETESEAISKIDTEPLEASGEAAAPQWIKYMAIAIAFTIAAAVLIRVFRALAGRGSAQKPANGMGEVRTHLVRGKERSPDAPAGSPTARVRAQYKKFLKLASAYSLGPEKSDTSLDVSRKCRGTFDEKAVKKLRNLYLKARYDEKANWEDSQQAKKLYAQIKESAGCSNPTQQK